MGHTRLLIVAACAWCIALSATVGQASTPAAESTRTVLMRLMVDDLPPSGSVVAGMTRTTFAPGAALVERTGSGAAVLWVENGDLAISGVEPDRPPRIFRTSETAGSGTPVTAGPDDTTLHAGDAVVLPSGSTAELRNGRDQPAAMLTLMASPDATAALDDDVVPSVIVGGESALPSMLVELVLERRTLEPAERLAITPKPTLTFVAAVVRKQNVKLGISPAGYTNRDAIPMPIYVLTVSEAT